jgi:hypothetical protein
MKKYGKWMYIYIYVIIISSLDAGQRLVSHPGRFIPGTKAEMDAKEAPDSSVVQHTATSYIG